MSLEPYERGATWWAKGRVEYNDLPISDYIRESTGASSKRGALEWISTRTDAEIRRYLIGEEEKPFTFNDAIVLYKPTPDMAKYLIPIADRFGDMLVKKITAIAVKEFAEEYYPLNSTDSWRRWVIAPVRAVINNAHAHRKCDPIRIDGFTTEERVAQDRKRGKASRVKKTPGSWEWLLKFRQHAPQRHGALALFMFASGARVGQSVAMHPRHLAKLDRNIVIVPGAKGHEDREIEVAPEVAADLRALPPSWPRGWERTEENQRVFGFASKDSARKAWISTCAKAGIPYLPPHSSGRHGFGQEMSVRQGVDEKAVEEVGGWSPEGGMVRRTYTHGEGSDGKVLAAFRTGLVQAQIQTGIKLLAESDKSDA